MKKFVIAVLLVGGVFQFWSRQPAAVVVSLAPPEVRISAPAAREQPVQRALRGRTVFEINGHEVRLLAEYAISARVLSTERYRSDRASQLSELDLALGWGNMAQREVAERISVSQGGRWYHWRYSGQPPIPHREIEQSSANVHIVAGSREVARVLATAGVGSIVSLRGYLIEAKGKDGWTWRSSLSRDDTGEGACEVLFVQWAEVTR